MKSWWKKALTESIQRRNEPCKWNITARGWHTLVLSSQSLQARHFSNQCDIYKVAKLGHRNWSHNHCNWSDTKLSVFTTARAVLTELYTQVPSLSRTHTHIHTPNILHALSQCAAFFVHLLFSCFLFSFLFKLQPVHVSDWLQIFPSCICQP